MLRKQFPLVGIQLLQILGKFVLMDVVHSDDSTQNLHSIEIVHGQDSAALVHIAEKPKSFTLAGVVISDQIDVNLQQQQDVIIVSQQSNISLTGSPY